MLTCGLVILNFNEYPVTENLLRHVKDAPEIDHIVLVDNGSTDESFSVLSKYQNDKISLIQSGRDGGYSFGNNFGVRYLIENFHPDIIGIANPDTIWDGSLVGRIKQVFEDNPDYAVLSGFQLQPSGENGIHPFWENDNRLASALRRTLIRPLRFIMDKLTSWQDYSAYLEGVRNSKNIPHQVWATEGSSFFIRREDFEAAGLFDENVFIYCEEDILAFKIDKWLHKKVGIVNSVTYIHAHKPWPKKLTLSVIRKILDNQRSIDKSAVYYFSHYVTDSRILPVIYALLLKLGRIKIHALYMVRMMRQKLLG